MISRRFAVLEPTDAAGIEAMERAYPGSRARRALRAIKSMIGELCYGSVWTGQPVTWAQWRQTTIAADRLSTLANACDGLLPTFVRAAHHHATSGQPIDLPRLCDLLSDALREYDALPRPTDAVLRPPGRATSYDTWLARPAYPRKPLVQHLLQHVRSTAPASVAAVLLHGSCADGQIVDGYSDLDAYFVLKTPASGAELLATIEWLLRCSAFFVAFNPCAHHGPMLVLSAELRAASDAILPAAVVDAGVWVHGTPPDIYDAPAGARLDAIGSMTPFEYFFERGVTRPADVRSAFDALWWTSNALILPVLVYELVERRSIYKRDCLTNLSPWLPEAFHPIVAELSRVRERLGAWIAARLPAAEAWPTSPAADGDVLPGVGVAYYKQQLALTDADRAALGLCDSLMLATRMMWEYCATLALESHRGELGRAGVATSRFLSWPHALVERPAGLSLDAYAAARGLYCAVAATTPGVLGVYEFGAIGCPGLSDLDFLVVLADDVQGVPDALRADAQPADVRRVLVHDPLFVARSALPLLGAVFPLFAMTRLVGQPLDVPLTSSFPPDVRLAMYSCSTSTKYPDDLIWLAKEPTTKWARLLAYANSFKHVATCLREVGAAVPEGVTSCAAYSDALRSQFLTTGIATTADLAQATDASLRAAADGIAAFEGLWRARLPLLNDLCDPFDPAVYYGQINWSRASDPNQFPPRPPALSIVRAFCMGGGGERIRELIATHAPLRADLHRALGEYVRLKNQFLAIEHPRGRTVSRYIHEPDPG